MLKINACENVIEYVTTELSAFGKSRKTDISAACREITTAIVAQSTSRNRMVATMSKLLHVSRKTLHKYTKFRLKIYETMKMLVGILYEEKHIKTGWKRASERR